MQKNKPHRKEKKLKCRQGSFSPETLAASHHRWRSVLASTPITLTIQVMVILVIQVVIIIRIQVMITLTVMVMIFQGKYLNKLQHLLREKIRRKLITSCRAPCFSVVGTC